MSALLSDGTAATPMRAPLRDSRAGALADRPSVVMTDTGPVYVPGPSEPTEGDEA